MRVRCLQAPAVAAHCWRPLRPRRCRRRWCTASSSSSADGPAQQGPAGTDGQKQQQSSSSDGGTDAFEVAWAAAAAASTLQQQPLVSSSQPGSSSSPSRAAAAGLAQLDMSGQARRYLLVSLALLGLGVVLAGAPEPFLAAALQAPPSALEVCFACLMGLALLFKAGVCLTLRQATLRRRLHSTSSQRVMLGCVLPVISHCLSFKAVLTEWGAAWSLPLLALYPAVLAAEFATHMAAFEVLNPQFTIKLLWPVAMGLLLSHLMPPLPTLSLPAGCTPAKASAAMLLSHTGLRWLAAAVRRVGPVAVKAARKYAQKQLTGRLFKRAHPSAGPPLTGTVVAILGDGFLPPSTAAGWGFFFIMLGHFAMLFHAYLPDSLFAGQVTPLSCLLKQCWAASGFLVAAFVADALKTAADRHHLAVEENRQLNICLLLLEGGHAACLACGLAAGAVAPSPYAQARLASAVAAALFCAGVALSSRRDAASLGWPVAPLSVSSVELQQQSESRAEFRTIASCAVVALNVITSCL